MKIGVIFPIFKALIDIALFICLNKNGADDLLWSSPEIIFAISSCLHSCRHLPEVLDYSRNYQAYSISMPTCLLNSFAVTLRSNMS